MNSIVLVCRVAVALVITSLLLAAVLFVSGEATVAWYMNHYGVPARIDLSEDYGLGMLATVVWVASFLLALPFACSVSWRLSGSLVCAIRKQSGTDSN